MSKEKVTIELPSYLVIDTTDGLKIEIDSEKYLDSLSTGYIVDNIENRYDYDPLDCASDNDLINELSERNFNLSSQLDDEDIENEYYNRGLCDFATATDYILEAARILSPKRILDKKTIKEIINEHIDFSIIHSYS